MLKLISSLYSSFKVKAPQKVVEPERPLTFREMDEALERSRQKKAYDRDQLELFNAITKGDVYQMRNAILRGVDINETDFCGRLALAHASIYGIEIMQEILNLGANLEALDDDGNTALIEAARYHRYEAVIFMIEQGANTDAKGKHSFQKLLSGFDKDNKERIMAAIENYRLIQTLESVDNHSVETLNF